MRRAAGRFAGLKLNQKFTLVVLSVVLVPVVLLAFVLFANMQNVVIEDRMAAAEANVADVAAGVERAVELCNMTSQVFLNSPSLRDFLVKAKTGEPFTAEELVEFQRGDAASFEKLVNANPYLYQTRVYFENESLPEFMPVLYHKSRMENLSWAAGDWQSGTWQLDYADTIFPAEIVRPTPHIMSLVTVIEDYEYGELGVLEVAVRMDEVLPELFGAGPGAGGCLVDARGRMYTEAEDAGFWRENLAEIEAALPEGGGVRATDTLPGDGHVRVVAVALPQLGAQYLSGVDLSDIMAEMAGRRNLFLLGTLGCLLLLALLINAIVKVMLRRFYLVIDAVTEVRDGNLYAKVPLEGDDEMGQLARQVNGMMDEIGRLVQDNINRQMLVKNSEIRALQSQINAHFLYNVLESIKMMAEVEGQYEISDAITSLGRLLRYSMRFTAAKVTLLDEVENAQNYLGLINLRFDYRTSLRAELPPHILQQRVPKLCLQPVIENAVVHGAEQLAEDSVIVLTVREGADGFFLTVADSGRGMGPAQLAALRETLAGGTEGDGGRGIGLKNVHDRMRMAFGPPYGIDVESEEGRFTRVTLHIPYTQPPERASEDAANS